MHPGESQRAGCLYVSAAKCSCRCAVCRHADVENLGEGCRYAAHADPCENPHERARYLDHCEYQYAVAEEVLHEAVVVPIDPRAVRQECPRAGPSGCRNADPRGCRRAAFLTDCRLPVSSVCLVGGQMTLGLLQLFDNL